MKIRITSVFISLALVISQLTGAAGQSLPDRIKERGRMIIAVVPNYPPLEYKDPSTGRLMGFDIDLGEALGKELGVAVEWQETSFEQMLSALVTGRIDMVLSSMSDAPARRDRADFVDYLISGLQFYTQASRSREFKEIADLCGQKVGANRRSLFLQTVRDWSDRNCIPNGRPPINAIGTEGSADARAQLKQGRLDAAVLGRENFPYLLQQEPNTYALVGAPIAPIYNGIAIRQTEAAFRDAVRNALQRLIDNGRYGEICRQHSQERNCVSRVEINGTPVEGQ